MQFSFLNLSVIVFQGIFKMFKIRTMFQVDKYFVKNHISNYLAYSDMDNNKEITSALTITSGMEVCSFSKGFGEKSFSPFHDVIMQKGN